MTTSLRKALRALKRGVEDITVDNLTVNDSFTDPGGNTFTGGIGGGGEMSTTQIQGPNQNISDASATTLSMDTINRDDVPFVTTDVANDKLVVDFTATDNDVLIVYQAISVILSQGGGTVDAGDLIQFNIIDPTSGNIEITSNERTIRDGGEGTVLLDASQTAMIPDGQEVADGVDDIAFEAYGNLTSDITLSEPLLAVYAVEF